MALSVTTAIQNKVANRVYSIATYASLTTQQKAVVDGEAESSLTYLKQYGQYFDLTSVQAPDAWEPWFISDIAARCEQSAHSGSPRVPAAAAQAQRDMIAALSTYTDLDITYSPGSTTDSFVFTLANVRKFVAMNCIRRPKPFMPAFRAIDAAYDETINILWNKSGHVYRKRPVLVKLTRITFSTATWTASSKTITQTSAFASYTHVAGTRCYITSGTGATLEERIVASRTSDNAIVLGDTISTSDLSTGDLTGFLLAVTFTGLESGETFDSIATTEFKHTSASVENMGVRWLQPDDMTIRRNVDGMTAGTPCYFRNHMVGTAVGWEFSPIPDGDYTLRGMVLTREPADPTTASDTTPFSKFVPEHLPLLRSMTLARVLMNAGRSDPVLNSQVNDELERFFPISESPGEPQAYFTSHDTRRDFDGLVDGGGQLGGGM